MRYEFNRGATKRDRTPKTEAEGYLVCAFFSSSVFVFYCFG